MNGIRNHKIRVILSNLMLAILPLGLFAIVEFAYNLQMGFWTSMSVDSLLLNYLLYGLVVVFTYCVFPHPRVSLVILTLVFFIYAAINHFVTELKGIPITISDIRAVRTAMAVMGDYEYAPDILLYKSIIVTIWMVFGIILLVRRPVDQGKKKMLARYATGVSAFVCFILLFINLDSFLSDVSNNELEMGDLIHAYELNGYLPVMLSDVGAASVKKPENYSPEKVEKILSQYDSSEIQKDESEQPLIIGIMNEAFSDLSVLGSISNQEKILDYVYSLKDDPNTISWGSCLVSIRGTGTANTEFEFLTGDSLRFFGNGCPYNYNSMRGVPNFASNIKAEEYTAIAMHPEAATNWRRNGVYPEFGFDDFLSYEDYIGYETISDEKDEVLNTDDPTKTGGRISDLGDYKKLIDVLEEQEAPSFLFNVTMQNHSGYSKLSKSVTENLVDSDPIINADEESATYETLISLSDDAIEYLVEYLRNYDKPVILVLFGDHQPDLDDSVENALMARNTEESSLAKSQKKYMTQYFIWANYDTGFKYTASDVVSANYLGILTRKAAGCKLSAFENYLLAQMEEIPAMNRFGYLADDGEWHSYDEENKYSHWFKNYELIQYNNLFDVEENQELFHVGN